MVAQVGQGGVDQFLQWLMQQAGVAGQGLQQSGVGQTLQHPGVDLSQLNPGQQYLADRASTPTPLEQLAQAPVNPVMRGIQQTQAATASANTPPAAAAATDLAAQNGPDTGTKSVDLNGKTYQIDGQGNVTQAGQPVDPAEAQAVLAAAKGSGAGSTPPSAAIAGPNQPATPAAPDPSKLAPSTGVPTDAQQSGPSGLVDPQTGGPSTNPATGIKANEYEYAYKPGDNLMSYAQHAFGQGMQASGNSLYTSDNQAALNPYQQWLKSRFGQAEPISALMHTLASGQGGDIANVASNAKADIGAFANNTGGSGTPGGMGAPMGGSYKDLHTLADMNARMTGGNMDGIDQGTQNYLRDMNSDKTDSGAMGMLLAAYNQKYGAMGQDAYMQRLQSGSQQFQASSNHPAGSPMFLNYMLNQPGMGN